MQTTFIGSVDVAQTRDATIAHVDIDLREHGIVTAEGTAKRNTGEPFDASVGVHLATARALQDIAEALVEEVESKVPGTARHYIDRAELADVLHGSITVSFGNDPIVGETVTFPMDAWTALLKKLAKLAGMELPQAPSWPRVLEMTDPDFEAQPNRALEALAADLDDSLDIDFETERQAHEEIVADLGKPEPGRRPRRRGFLRRRS